MNKIKLTSLTKISFSAIFDNLQIFIQDQINKLISLIISNYGIPLGNYGNNLKLVINDSSSLLINSGIALFNNKEFIKIDNNIIKTVDLSTDGYFLVSLKYINITSDVVPVMNGFNYDYTAATPQVPSIIKDSYEIVITQVNSIPNNVNNDELILGIYAINGGEINTSNYVFDGKTADNGIIDLRYLNTLIMKDTIINNLLLTKLSVDNLTIIQNNTNSGISVLNSNGDRLINIDSNSVNFNTDVFINNKKPILDNYDTANKILNFKITDITTTSIPKLLALNNVTTDAGGSDRHKLKILVEWGWNGIYGTGEVNGIFNISNNLNTTEDISNHWLFLPSKGKNYFITSYDSTTNKITVIDKDTGLEPDLSDVSIAIDSASKAIINYNANYYEIDAIITNTNEEVINTLSETIRIYRGNPIIQKAALTLIPGATYTIKIRAIQGINITDWTVMLDGSYTKWGTVYNYGNGDGTITIQAPSLDKGNTSFTVSQKDSGFQTSLIIDTSIENGWDKAEEFELAWVEGTAPVDFNNPNSYESVILPSDQRFKSITTTESKLYQLAIRPLLGGTAVSDPLTAYVVSGSAGVPPIRVPVISSNVSLRTWSANVDYYNLTNKIIKLKNAKTIEGNVLRLGSINEGAILNYNGTDFILKEFLDISGTIDRETNTTTLVHVFSIEPLNNSTLPNDIPSDTLLFANTSNRGRFITKVLLPVDTKLLNIEYKSIFTDGSQINPGTIRVYQEGASDVYDNLLVTQSDTTYRADFDLSILSSKGDRYVVIDAVDPISGHPGNQISLIGELTIYGQPYSNSANDKKVAN